MAIIGAVLTQPKEKNIEGAPTAGSGVEKCRAVRCPACTHPKAQVPTTSIVMRPSWRQMSIGRPSSAALASTSHRRAAELAIRGPCLPRLSLLKKGCQALRAVFQSSPLHTQAGGPAGTQAGTHISPEITSWDCAGCMPQATPWWKNRVAAAVCWWHGCRG